VTKSHIHAANASARLERPALQTTPMKRGRGKDLQPRKQRTPGEVRTYPWRGTYIPLERYVHTPGEVCGGELPRKQRTPGEVHTPGEVCGGVLPCIELGDSEREAPVDSTEIAINFVKTGKVWDRTLVNLDDAFCFHISQHMDDDCDPTTVVEVCSRSDWPMWKEAMRSELESLKSRKVFVPVETTPKGVNPVGCKWVFVRKRDQFGPGRSLGENRRTTCDKK
jgi:hypothetical protein